MSDQDIRSQAIELLASTEYTRVANDCVTSEPPWGELAAPIRDNWRSSFERHVDVLLAAGWRPPARIVETAEELRALPRGTFVVVEGTVRRKRSTAKGSQWFELEEKRWRTHTQLSRLGAATVLWTPEVTNA